MEHEYDIEKLINNAKVNILELFGIEGLETILDSGSLYGNIEIENMGIALLYDGTRQISYDVKYYVPKLLKAYHEIQNRQYHTKFIQ